MEISRFRNDLSDYLDHIVLLSPQESLLAMAGDEILGMSRCYRDDGCCFLEQGDQVNAVASFSYAAGWIDTGVFIGIFKSGSLCKRLLSERADIQSGLVLQLTEKSNRYKLLLEIAIASSEPGGEKGISWHEGGIRIITIASAYARGGRMFLQKGRYENALACFSYGHGWLDAAVRAGLIRIIANSEIFAI
jgi:uncharacterized protein